MKKQPWYVRLILAALIGGLAYQAHFKPRQAELDRLRAERDQVETELVKLREKKRQLTALEAELQALTAKLAELEPIIPGKKEIGEMLRNVQLMAGESDLEVIRFVPDRATVIDFYAEQPVPIEIL